MGELWIGRRHNYHMRAFPGVKPRAAAGLAAEARYNHSLTYSSKGDTAALNTLVEQHMRDYPGGLDDNHRREQKREALDRSREERIAEIVKNRR